MEDLNEYVELCQRIGNWTDWVQGVGGNCSVKNEKSIIIKQSGSRISDTTLENGWVICDIEKLKKCITDKTEFSEDTVLYGKGRPSIEAFMHTIPYRIIAHLHPAPLMPKLCSITPIDISESYVPYRWLPYIKPGVQIADIIMKDYNHSTQIYFLQNHGVIICGDTVVDILDKMNWISNTLFDTNKIHTDIPFISVVYDYLLSKYKQGYMIKTWYKNVNIIDSKINPYSPDILVFLQREILIYDSSEITSESINYKLKLYIEKYNTFPSIIMKDQMLYIVSKIQSQLYDIIEILYSYESSCESTITLSDDSVNEIIHWDKEKIRKNGSNEEDKSP